jgi:hypothetical protein
VHLITLAPVDRQQQPLIPERQRDVFVERQPRDAVLARRTGQ